MSDAVAGRIHVGPLAFTSLDPFSLLLKKLVPLQIGSGAGCRSLAYLAGRIPRTIYAQASKPMEGRHDRTQRRRIVNQTITVRAGTDGILTLALGEAYANELIQVTLQTIPETSREEWLRFIDNTAGKWEGELERPTQGEYEERDPLE